MTFRNIVTSFALLSLFLASPARGVLASDLGRAVTAGNLEQVRRLLAGGADPDSKDNNERTPLHDAVLSFHKNKGCGLRVVQALLKAEAATDLRDDCGAPPLLYAVRLYRVHHSLELVRILLASGADADGPDGWGRTPLLIATENREIELCAVLLRYGADINAASLKGETPLHTAARIGDVVGCRFLVEHGASMAAVDHRGLTPLGVARWRQCKEAEQYLNSVR